MSVARTEIFPEPAVLHSPFTEGRIKTLLFTVLQLALLFSGIYFFKFETDSRLQNILPVVFFGYLIHECLPLRFRLPFFLFLGIFSIYFIAGIVTANTIILLGLLLLGISQLSVKPIVKTLAVIALLTFLALVHLRFISVPFIPSALPFLASMFMFRFIIYLYEIRYEKKKSTVWQRLSYFFMLPNICFPLFPIVDYKNFTRNYYDIPYEENQKLAVKRIFRGITHLIAYRFIYYYLIPSVTEIDNLFSLLQYVVFSYALILRLSGIFHLALGIIGLFGFNLPEIFNNYFLASSFSDLWRRINIYWREFVIKIFYQPIYFKIKKRFGNFALPITILIVFCINWLLHNYQWFWLHGGIQRKGNDVLFWLIFGITVMLNSLYQRKRQSSAAPAPSLEWTVKNSFLKMLQIGGMLLFMCFLWSLWCSSSTNEWLYLLSFSGTVSNQQVLTLLISLLALILIGIFIDYILQNENLSRGILVFIQPGQKTTLLYSVALLLIAAPQTNTYLPATVKNLIARLQEDKLNKTDKLTMERGYYQKMLNDEGAITREISKSEGGNKKEWTETNSAQRKTNNLLLVELLPLTRVEFKGAYIKTNSWGMRDKEYKKEKDSNTFRIAVLGGSYEMGSGMEDGKNFESLLEINFNSSFTNFREYEILNFAVGGYHVFQNIKVCEEKALSFSPNVVLYFAHSDEYFRASRKLSELIITKTDLEHSFLKEVVKLAGVNSNMCAMEIEKKLIPFMPALIKWCYFKIASDCKQKGATPVWVFLPAIDDPMAAAELDSISKMAVEGGFLTISLEDVYKNYTLDSIKLSSWDNHPNESGHQIISKLLFEKLKEKQKELKF